jgi:hypothetical protein
MAIVVIPEAPADEWDYPDWVEKMGQEKPGGAGTFSHQMSEDTLVITLPGNQVRSCVRQVLGWSWADVAAPWQLRREACPIQHPRFPWLWADAVSVQPHNPLAQLQTDLTYKPKTEGVGFGGYSPTHHGCYARADVTVRFRPAHGEQWRDDDPKWSDDYSGKEWLRSFGLLNKSVQLDIISTEGANDDASLYFADGVVNGGGTGPLAGPGGTPFNGTQFVRYPRTVMRFLWKNVPQEYLSGEFVFTESSAGSRIAPYPARLVRALGRVNSAPFPGADSPYVAGTLLFTGFEEIPYQQPVRTDTEFGLWASDVILTFEHVDPPLDPTARTYPDDGSVADVKRGWHLYPYRPTSYFYYATAGTEATRGTYSGVSQLREYDFHHLFRHRSDTGSYPLP